MSSSAEAAAAAVTETSEQQSVGGGVAVKPSDGHNNGAKSGIKPSDILPDNVNSIMINGVEVRKGSVAAVVANIQQLESANATEESKQAAIDAIKSLVPSLRAQGLLNHVTFNNPVVQALMAART